MSNGLKFEKSEDSSNKLNTIKEINKKSNFHRNLTSRNSEFNKSKLMQSISNLRLNELKIQDIPLITLESQ